MGSKGGKRIRGRAAAPAVLLVALACSYAAPPPADAVPRPNVLLIVTDDQPAMGTMQAMPATKAWFDAYGTRFENAYATTPLCCPSRASIFSGRYAHNHGQHRNIEAMFDHSTSFVRYLDQAGYRTGIVGKYLNWWWPSEAPPNFDDYKVTSGGYYHSLWGLNGRTRYIDEYATTFTRRKSVGFIRNAETNDARPWLLYVAPGAPHLPAEPEPKYADADVGPFPANPATEEEDLGDKPSFLLDLIEKTPVGPDETPEAVRASQLRTLMSVDNMVAALLRNLVWLGEREKTLIVFLSDNGLFWGEHDVPPIKSLAYPESTRIPLMVSWTGHVAEGAVDSRLVANLDIAPTIMDAVGLTLDESAPPIDGRSLLDPTWTRERLLLEYFGAPRRIPKWAGLVTPTVQYTQYGSINGHPWFREYYATDTDPWRLENLLANASSEDDPPPEAVQALSQQLGKDLACAGASCP